MSHHVICRLSPLTSRLGPPIFKSLLTKTTKPSPRAIHEILRLNFYTSKCSSSQPAGLSRHSTNEGFDWPTKVLSDKSLLTSKIRGLVQCTSSLTLCQRHQFHTSCRRYLDFRIVKLRKDIKNVYKEVQDMETPESRAESASKKIQDLVTSFYLEHKESVPFVSRDRLVYYNDTTKLFGILKSHLALNWWRNKDGENCVLTNRNSKEWRKVDDVMRRLKAGNPELRDQKYQVYILDNQERNEQLVCSYHPGQIFISRSEVNRYTDDELAFVLGHEIGHIVLQHDAEIGSNKQFILESMVHGSSVIRRLVDISTNHGYSQPNMNYIREIKNKLGMLIPTLRDRYRFELEADYVALTCMCKANYDPKSTIDLIQNGNYLSAGSDILPKDEVIPNTDEIWQEMDTLSILHNEKEGVIKNYINECQFDLQYPSVQTRADHLEKCHQQFLQDTLNADKKWKRSLLRYPSIQNLNTTNKQTQGSSPVNPSHK